MTNDSRCLCLELHSWAPVLGGARHRSIVIAAMAIAALLASGCERKPERSSAAPAPTAAKAPDDPRVPCPAGTVQKRLDGQTTPALRIWCEDANGYKHGPSRTWFLDTGQISEANFNHGATDGIQREWYGEGAPKSEAHYRDGVEEGPYRSWHPNGRQEFELEYRGGEPVGVGRWWDENGRLVKTKRYSGDPSAAERSASPAPR